MLLPPVSGVPTRSRSASFLRPRSPVAPRKIEVAEDSPSPKNDGPAPQNDMSIRLRRMIYSEAKKYYQAAMTEASPEDRNSKKFLFRNAMICVRKSAHNILLAKATLGRFQQAGEDALQRRKRERDEQRRAEEERQRNWWDTSAASRSSVIAAGTSDDASGHRSYNSVAAPVSASEAMQELKNIRSSLQHGDGVDARQQFTRLVHVMFDDDNVGAETKKLLASFEESRRALQAMKDKLDELRERCEEGSVELDNMHAQFTLMETRSHRTATAMMEDITRICSLKDDDDELQECREHITEAFSVMRSSIQDCLKKSRFDNNLNRACKVHSAVNSRRNSFNDGRRQSFEAALPELAENLESAFCDFALHEATHHKDGQRRGSQKPPKKIGRRIGFGFDDPDPDEKVSKLEVVHKFTIDYAENWRATLERKLQGLGVTLQNIKDGMGVLTITDRYGDKVRLFRGFGNCAGDEDDFVTEDQFKLTVQYSRRAIVTESSDESSSESFSSSSASSAASTPMSSRRPSVHTSEDDDLEDEQVISEEEARAALAHINDAVVLTPSRMYMQARKRFSLEDLAMETGVGRHGSIINFSAKGMKGKYAAVWYMKKKVCGRFFDSLEKAQIRYDFMVRNNMTVMLIGREGEELEFHNVPILDDNSVTEDALLEWWYSHVKKDDESLSDDGELCKEDDEVSLRQENEDSIQESDKQSAGSHAVEVDVRKVALAAGWQRARQPIAAVQPVVACFDMPSPHCTSSRVPLSARRRQQAIFAAARGAGGIEAVMADRCHRAGVFSLAAKQPMPSIIELAALASGDKVCAALSDTKTDLQSTSLFAKSPRKLPLNPARPFGTRLHLGPYSQRPGSGCERDGVERPQSTPPFTSLASMSNTGDESLTTRRSQNVSTSAPVSRSRTPLSNRCRALQWHHSFGERRDGLAHSEHRCLRPGLAVK